MTTGRPAVGLRRAWKPTPSSTPATLPTGTQPPLLLPLGEGAAHLRYTGRPVEGQVGARRLHVVHIGRAVRVERVELDRFLSCLRDRDDG